MATSEIQTEARASRLAPRVRAASKPAKGSGVVAAAGVVLALVSALIALAMVALNR
jgi:hypothetical protein